MKDQVSAAMPACFKNWCRRFDDIFSRQKLRQAFRIYLGELLGESERKNLSQLASNTVDGSAQQLATFLERVSLECREAEPASVASDAILPSN